MKPQTTGSTASSAPAEEIIPTVAAAIAAADPLRKSLRLSISISVIAR
jgi:hypothetical protein